LNLPVDEDVLSGSSVSVFFLDLDFADVAGVEDDLWGRRRTERNETKGKSRQFFAFSSSLSQRE